METILGTLRAFALTAGLITGGAAFAPDTAEESAPVVANLQAAPREAALINPYPMYEPSPPAPEPPLALRGIAEAVAACESGHRLPDGTAEPGTHDWEAQNTVSTASGAFQFINGTWRWVWEDIIGEPAPSERARDALPHEQYRAFLALWDGGRGAGHWAASEGCWGREDTSPLRQVR